MSGKLPIDRAREAKFSRKQLEEQKHRMGTEQADLRDEVAAHEESQAADKRKEEQEQKESED